MDLILNLADEYILDAVWGRVVPASAFTGFPVSANSTLATPLAVTALSKWETVASRLPHPPLLAAFGSDAALSAWPRDYIPRQLISLAAITLIGVHALYFVFSTLSYYFIFNHDMMNHPRFLKNQVRMEIESSLRAFPIMMLLTLPLFQAEVMGYSRLYSDPAEHGYVYLALSSLMYEFLRSFAEILTNLTRTGF